MFLKAKMRFVASADDEPASWAPEALDDGPIATPAGFDHGRVMRPFTRASAALLLTVACATARQGSSAGDTIERIKSNKVLKLGYRDSSVPFSFVGVDGKPMGYSIDLC